MVNMAILTELEKKELKDLVDSEDLRNDNRRIVSQRHDLFHVDGEVIVDNLIEFLTMYNEFINHETPPFRKMIDKIMKL